MLFLKSLVNSFSEVNKSNTAWPGSEATFNFFIRHHKLRKIGSCENTFYWSKKCIEEAGKHFTSCLQMGLGRTRRRCIIVDGVFPCRVCNFKRAPVVVYFQSLPAMAIVRPNESVLLTTCQISWDHLARCAKEP